MYINNIIFLILLIALILITILFCNKNSNINIENFYQNSNEVSENNGNKIKEEPPSPTEEPPSPTEEPPSPTEEKPLPAEEKESSTNPETSSELNLIFFNNNTIKIMNTAETRLKLKNMVSILLGVNESGTYKLPGQ